ncbi:MAG: bifunctional oligoribonuclease/PAP phosphatase NrnA, partial [Treponema sp.]|nr:bifunctional oligoribonuclease/PAP phosphatase NrnA [Treponema sp.]
DEVLDFLKRHSSLIITTHDTSDADGLGAEIAVLQICREKGIRSRILNSSDTPLRFAFMDPQKIVEVYDKTAYSQNGFDSALMILDSSDEYNIGEIRELIPCAREVFIIDHHDHAPTEGLKGLIDSTASSTCEIITELAETAGVKLDPVSCAAIYAGISYDTGSFIYPKTTARTFCAALRMVEGGAVPNRINHELNETASIGALLLNQRVLSTLKIKNGNRVAVQIMHKEDLETFGANIEDAEEFINIPLKSRDIIVSVLIKENREGQIRCSLRSKGEINVSKIARIFGGGGHVTASGFKSPLGIGETLTGVLEKITAALELMDQ